MKGDRPVQRQISIDVLGDEAEQRYIGCEDPQARAEETKDGVFWSRDSDQSIAPEHRATIRNQNYLTKRHLKEINMSNWTIIRQYIILRGPLAACRQ